MEVGIEDSGNASFMRNVKNILQAMIIVVLCWVAHSVSESNTQIAVLQVQVSALVEAMKEAKGNVQDRYTSYDAEKDFRSRDGQIAHNANEIEQLHKQIEDIIAMRHK